MSVDQAGATGHGAGKGPLSGSGSSLDRLWDLMLVGLGSPCTVSSPPFPVIWFSSAKPHNPLRLLTGFQDVTLGVFSRGRSL